MEGGGVFAAPTLPARAPALTLYPQPDESEHGVGSGVGFGDGAEVEHVLTGSSVAPE